MAVKVKWTGNAADLPHPQETNKKPTVRYVGTGEGGVTYQPSVTVKTKNSENTDLGGSTKKGDRVIGSPGGTFLGGFSYKGKSRREKTAQEQEAEKQAQMEAYEEYVRLATLDLDAQEKAIAEAKEKAAQSKPKYNIHAFGAYDTTQTDEEKNYSKLLADLNKAKSIQYDIKGRKELDALSVEQTDALGRLSEASRPQTSVMATNQANEDAAQKAKGELKASGLSDEKIRELLGYYKNIPKREKNAETYEDIQGAAEAYAETNPGLATVASVGTNIVSGIGAIGSAINRALDPNTPVDYHGGEFLPYAYTSGVRDTASQNLEKDYGKGASFAYGVGTSMLDSAATVGLTMAGVPSWLATSTLGGAAATAAMQEAKDRGLDDDRAIWTGLLAGVAETTFEKVSLESLITMKAPTGTVRQRVLGMLKNTAKQAGIEGSEEVFTDFANLITDGIINGDLSQARQEMAAYMAEGMTEEEARNKAVGGWLKDTAVDFTAGALAGGIMGGGANALSRAGQKAETKREYAGREQELIDRSKELLPNNQEAEKLRSKMQNKLGSKRGLTGGDIEKLLQSNVDAPFVSDVDKITAAVKNQLELYGESGNTDLIASAVTKRLLRENESGKETDAFVNSKYGQRVLNELNPENFDGENRTEDDKPRALFNSEWAGKIGTKVFAPEVFSRDVGVTGAKYNAETGKLDAIVKDDAGKIKTVPAEKAELSPLQEELFDWAADLGEAGPVLVSAYRERQNLETYARQFHNAYEYGKAGVPMDYVNKSQAVSYLNTTQREIAYEEGAKAHQRELQGRKEKKRPGGTVDSSTQKKPTVSLRGATVGGVKYAPVNKKAMDGRQWASVGTMKAFAQAAGVNVVFYESQANERGEYEGANGFYKDGTLYLDINAGRDRVAMGETAILKTAAHEITHYIKEGSPEQYEVLKNFVVEKLTREKGISFDDLVTDKQRREPGLSYEEAVDEVVADACEMMLKDSKAVEQLARENQSLAERIRQWIRKWVRSLKAAMEGLTADRPESRAMMQYAQELQKIWDNALVGAARNGRRAESKTRYSYSGVRAKTANRSALQKAVEMRNREKSNEEIRKETGWFVGMDGKWRFEISDADIRFDAEGKLHGKNKNDVKTLADYISHEKLFEAYPDLAEVPVYFAEMQNGDYGTYSRGLDEIALNRSLLEDPKQLLDTLVHEVQHAIQERERFSPGASLAYWNRRLEEGADVRTQKEKQEGERLQKELDEMKKSDPEFVADMEKLNKMAPSVSRGAINWDTLEQIEPDPPEWVAFDRERDRLEEKYGDRIFDWFTLQDQIEMNRKKQSRMPRELYYNTAGEIEARDSAARRTLTEAQRKEKAPNLGNDNTVFAESGVRYSVREVGGETMPVLDVQNDTRNYKVAEAYLKTLVDTEHPFSTILVDAQPVYIGKDLPGEYRSSEYTKSLRKATRAVKMQAVTNLDEMLLLAENGEWRENVKTKHKRDAKNGWYRYSTRFALPVMDIKKAVDHYTVYSGTLLIRNDADGKSYLYDLLDIKKEKVISSTSFSARERSEVFEPKPSQQQYMRGEKKSQGKNIDKVQNSMRDSVGRELTEAQQEYFKDSKVRNADGKLKPVYHGSAAIFTKFSADFMSQNGSSEGQGFYFTDYKPMAQGYEKNGGQLLEGYLDIKKPLSDSEVTLTAAEVKQLIKAVDPTGDDLVLNYDSRGGIGYPSRAWYNRSVEDTLRATMSTSESDSEILAELANGMGDPGKVLKTVRELLGYDGYIVESKYDNATVYVAFDSSQFKNADNKTPTTDPDIRFQQREPRLSDRAVLEWAAEMALRDKNKSWTAEDREQLERFRNRMRMLQDTQAELEALKEERKVLLAGRKVSEITGEERTEVSKNKNRIDIAKNKAERYEAEVWELESKAAIKTLLRKSRSIVETEASYQARKEYRERQEEREMVNVTRRKVKRNAKRLLEYMNTNTDKKHIPEALKKPIGELLESLNFYSNSARRGGYTSRADMKYYEAMQGLQAALAKQKAFDDTGEGTDVFKGYLDLPAGFESLLAVHLERVKNVMEKHPLKTDVVRAMDLEDLRDLDVILSVMSRSVTKMNEMFIKRRFAYVADAAEDSIITMHRLGQHQDKPGERFALWDNTLPWYAFQRFGEGGKAVFEGLQDGWDKLAFNMKTILDFRQDLISDALARKWDTETHKVELTDPDGAKVTATLTTAQLMSLRCLSKRKQALGHLLGGGIRPDAIEITNTLGDKIKKKKWNQDKQFKLTEESLGQLLKLLTPEQIKVADAMQKFMTEQGSAWGNAISMARFGYRAFTEQNYFPIETDRQDREAKTGDAKEGSLYRLQNISAVKPLVKDANNALILRGIFDVFANHTADMAKYNALVLPIIDAQKWYNYRYGEKNEAGQVSTRTVQRAMTKAYGEVANNFVIKYLQDLNGVKENGDRGDTIPKRMISNYKRAMVAANMRVAILQPTAYARASAVLDYKYLAKAFADKTGTKQATKEMLENSGIALWKSLGFFDTDVGRSIRDQIKGRSSKIEDLVDKTMVPAEKGDEVTWARLWRACKLEVQDKNHLAGEELLKATAERFREVVYRTQVVDSTMTRSHAMRGSGTLTKMATSFMSEPTVSYNMVMESTRQIAEDAKRMGLRPAIRRNWKTAGRAYQAYIVSAIVTAIVESLYDALRDSDDDKYLDKVWKALGGEKPETVKDGILDVIFGLNGNLAGDINPIGKVPYLRDVVSVLGGYSNGRMDTEAVANLKKAIDIWDEVIRLQTGDLDKATKTTYYGNMTTYGMIYPTAKALSQLTGLPGSAAMREVATAWNTTVGTVWPALKMRTYEDKKLREAWENYGKDSGVSYAVMYRAIQDLKEIESDRDADGNAISGSLKAKYVDYIQGLGLTQAQKKAVWEAAKNSSWSDKGTPWG